MYAKILNNAVVKYPYQWVDFITDNNNTNYGYAQPEILSIFPQTDIAKQGYTVVSIVSVAQPTINEAIQSISEGEPFLLNDVWTKNWIVTTLTEEQQDALTKNKANAVRSDRTAKLAACDWTQLVDSTVDKAAWATYRAALRDITKADGFPWTMVWPTQP